MDETGVNPSTPQPIAQPKNAGKLLAKGILHAAAQARDGHAEPGSRRYAAGELSRSHLTGWKRDALRVSSGAS